MPIEITMPRLSDTMEQGTIVSWNVKEGDTVAAGDVLGDIETDKATMELQTFDDGVVAHIALDAGHTVDVGAPILVLAEDGEDAAEVKAGFKGGGGSKGGDSAKPEASKPKEEPEVAGSGSSASSGSTPGSVSNGQGGRIFASPLARKIADERGIDLVGVEGSGPGGRIVRADVESIRETPLMPSPGAPKETRAPTAPLPRFGDTLKAQRLELSNMRATIAKRLLEAKATVPHYQVTMTVAMDAIMELRKQLNTQLKDQGIKLSVNDFVVRACALAILRHPYVNASWGSDGRSLDLNGNVNIGVAIALPVELGEGGAFTGGGLVVATIRKAGQIGLREISEETKRLADKARTRGLSIDEMSDATFTISNLGMYGVEHFTAIINPPNSAILAVGGAIKKPVVRTDEDGEDYIDIGHEMQMTLSSDHRIIDGAMAAEFLATIKSFLEAPATLLV